MTELKSNEAIMRFTPVSRIREPGEVHTARCKEEFVHLFTRCRKCVEWQKYDNTAGCGRCMNSRFAFSYSCGEYEYIFHPITEPDFGCLDGIPIDGYDKCSDRENKDTAE